MNPNRSLVKTYFEEGKSATEIFRLLKNQGVKRPFVYYWCKRFREGGSINDAKKSGRPRSVRTKKLIKVVCDRIRRNPERRCRKLVTELNVSRISISRLSH